MHVHVCMYRDLSPYKELLVCSVYLSVYFYCMCFQIKASIYNLESPRTHTKVIGASDHFIPEAHNYMYPFVGIQLDLFGATSCKLQPLR